MIVLLLTESDWTPTQRDSVYRVIERLGSQSGTARFLCGHNDAATLRRHAIPFELSSTPGGGYDVIVCCPAANRNEGPSRLWRAIRRSGRQIICWPDGVVHDTDELVRLD